MKGLAIPVQPGKTHMLVDYPGLLSNAQPGITLERDIVLILLMWEKPMQGNNCGKLTWSDFFMAEGQQAVDPMPGPVLPGSSVVILPNATKTVKRQRSGPWTLTAASDTQHSCLPRLLGYLQLRYPEVKIVRSAH